MTGMSMLRQVETRGFGRISEIDLDYDASSVWRPVDRDVFAMVEDRCWCSREIR
jgi:hypothetical protein